ncbi:MAG: nitroreductase family protein, partial [Spirochaetales bacterium]|nr:nitroreductase family protein [Spirochaetales bacterium]
MKMRFISLLMLVCVSVSPLFADSALLAANPAAESVLSAYSTREFSEVPLKAGQLDLILQAGANAPSAQNRQPWTFIVVENSEIRSRLFKSLPEACAVVV